MATSFVARSAVYLQSFTAMSLPVNGPSDQLGSGFLNRFCRGLASSFLGQVLSAASAIILVPLFLHAWGAEGYGRWLSLTALISYLSLLDLGGASFVGNLLARAYAQSNEEEFLHNLSMGVSLFIMIAAGAACGLAILLCLPGLSLPGQSSPLNFQERLILLFMGMIFLIAIPGGVYTVIYRSTGLLARGYMVGNISKTLFLLCSIAVLGAGLPPVIYAGLYLGIGLVTTGAMIYDTQRRIPCSRGIRLGLAEAWEGRHYLKGSLLFWLLALAYALNQQGLILLLAANAAPAMVALFVTHRTASGLVGYVGGLILAPLWPELTFMEARKEKEKLKRMALLAIKMVASLSGAAALLLWVALPVIYPIWTGRQLHFESGLLALLLLQAVLAAGWNTSSWVLLATNKHRDLALLSLANAILTLTLALFLVPRFGFMGAAWATLLGDVLCGLAVFPLLASRFFEIRAWEPYMAFLLPLLLLTLTGGLLHSLGNYVTGWNLLVVGAVLTILMLFVALRLTLASGELSWLWARSREFVRGKV